MTPRSKLPLLAAAVLAFATGVCAIEPKPPAIDVTKTVNASYNFRKDEEPEMSSDEYALYEKIVGMLSLNREFAMKLLEPMAAAKTDATPAFLFLLGNVYFTNGQPEAAEGYYRRAIDLLPTFTRAWGNLGNLFFTQGKYQEAVDCFTKVTATGDRDVQTLSLLAYCMDRTGRPIGAEMNYVQALGIDPDHIDSLRGLMSMSFNNGQHARAEELLKQLIRLDPKDRQNWTTYGSLLIAQDRPIEAIGLLESAAALDFVDNAGLILLCDLYTEQGFQVEASRAFERLQAKDPALAASRRLHYVRSLVSEGKFEAAERELTAVASSASADRRPEVWQVEAELRTRQERWEDARALYEKILQVDPFKGEALMGLGASLKVLGEAAAAELVFDRAAQVPEFAYRAYVELADSALRQRIYPRALIFLERAAAIQKSPALESYISKVRLIVSNHENM
jgi:tetratricopeptide (TPR) repeat protein